jgi:hypothetical protein
VEWAITGRRGKNLRYVQKIKITKTGGKILMGSSFMRVDDVAAELGVSKSYAYKIVRKLNAELKNMGDLIVAGRISKKYWLYPHMCGRHLFHSPVDSKPLLLWFPAPDGSRHPTPLGSGGAGYRLPPKQGYHSKNSL